MTTCHYKQGSRAFFLWSHLSSSSYSIDFIFFHQWVVCQALNFQHFKRYRPNSLDGSFRAHFTWGCKVQKWPKFSTIPVPTLFATWLCSPSHQRVESTSPPLKRDLVWAGKSIVGLVPRLVLGRPCIFLLSHLGPYHLCHVDKYGRSSWRVRGHMEST